MFSFDLYSPAVEADPFPLYRVLRDEHPCYWSSEAKMWVLARHADSMAALSSWQTYSSARVTAKILFRMLGLPAGDDREVRERAVMMVQSDPVSRQKGPDHLAAYNWMQDYAAGVIAERRRNPAEDLISQFCVAEIDGERLAERAAPRAELVANPALLPDAIEESLRYNTSAQRFRRSLMRDTTLHGQQLPWMPSSTYRSPVRLEQAIA